MQKTAYEMRISLEFRRVLFRSQRCGESVASAASAECLRRYRSVGFPGRLRCESGNGRPPAGRSTGPAARADRLRCLERKRVRRDRKSVVEGKRVAVRLALGGRRILKKKTYMKKTNKSNHT